MTEPRSDLEHIARLYIRAATALDPVRFQAWESLGLTLAQLRILFRVRRRPGENVRKLAEELGISASAVSQQVDRLVGRGLLDRSDHPGDRRQVVLAVSVRGSEITDEISRAYRERIEALLADLSQDELKDLQRLLERLVGEPA